MNIAYTEAYRMGDVKKEKREQIKKMILPIVKASFEKFDENTVPESLCFRNHNGQLRLFFSKDRKVIGFSTVSPEIISWNKKEWVVIEGGAYFLPAVKRPGLTAAFFAIPFTIKQKLKNIKKPLAYGGLFTNPAIYSFSAKIFPVIYPSQQHPMPDELTALLKDKYSRIQNINIVNDAPLMVKLFPTPRLKNINRINNSKMLQACEAARWFANNNPDYHAGQWLVYFIPLNLINLYSTIKTIIWRFTLQKTKAKPLKNQAIQQ